MIVKFQHYIHTEEKVLIKGEGECEMNNPVMVSAQIPIEKEQYIKLNEACKEQKISIYDLLVRALEIDPEEIKYIF